MAPKMTEQQRHDTALIMEVLQQAGWSKTDRATVFGVADLTYQNETLEVGMVYEWTDNLRYFHITHTTQELSLAIAFETNLQELLQLVVSFQDQMSSDNFRSYIRALLNLCPSTYVDTGDELIPLKDDEADGVDRSAW